MPTLPRTALFLLLALQSPTLQVAPPPVDVVPEGAPPRLAVADAEAESREAMKPYRERIPGTDAAFDLVPIGAGTFVMGSPRRDRERRSPDSPAHEVRVDAFWMGRCEVTWDEYHPFMLRLDIAGRQGAQEGGASPAEPAKELAPQDRWADAVSRPTPPYVPMDFEMGVEGMPAICMTQFAAKQYTKWLSMKTGRFYRLPTEAEWEYACRAGTTTTWSFGDDLERIDAHAWSFRNSQEHTHPVGTLAANPWGLHDMHGNVAEWVLDAFDARTYERRAGSAVVDPVVWPTSVYPRVVRGGSWDDDPPALASAARRPSREDWKLRDPQFPKSIWYLTDPPFVGFRVVRPFVEPSLEERAKYWEADVEEIRLVEQGQRSGER